MKTVLPIVLDAGGQEAHTERAALRATVAVFPFSAALITIVVYSLLQAAGSTAAQGVAIAYGAVIGAVVWLWVALYYRRFVAADSANLRNYTRLRERLNRLENQLKHVCPALSNEPQENSKNELDKISRSEAYEMALGECKEIRKGLKGKGMPWVTGTGYIELWHRIHRAEETLIKILPICDVIAGAMRDEMRLLRSNMVNRDSLLTRLRGAVSMLDNSTIEKDSLVKRLRGTAIRMEGSAISKAVSYLTEPTEISSQWEPAKARTILGGVRYEINSFRDDVWEGMVHARNRLIISSALLGLAAYLLLVLAVVANASSNALLGATAYFLVGAIVGLFARSQAEAGMDSATDDFGLSTARLIHIPLFSGLGAVGGVVIAAVLDNQFFAQRGGSSVPSDWSFTDIFTFSPSFLIVAAVFGLTPDLIIRRLAQQSERYKDDLRSTETSQNTETDQNIEAGRHR